MNQRLHLLTLLLAGIFFLASPPAAKGEKRPPSRNILLTPHNLSSSGGGGAHDIQSSTESRVCIFCHTPHHAQSFAPLWSREVSALTIYIPYQSPTLRVAPQQPTGASRVCLSCHDGTIALGLLAGGINLDPSLGTMPHDPDPRRNANLATDLADDHPVSFPYLPGNPQMHDPLALPPEIRLASGDILECTACHDPHDNQFGNFLVIDSSSQKDALCTSCHRKAGWDDSDSAHRTGGSRYPAVAPQVAAEGCLNCHLPHSAPGKPYLLRAVEEENNCLAACHRNDPYTDIWSQFATTAYNHPVADYLGTHKTGEQTGGENLPIPAAQKHVECVDCHNPHQAGWQGAPMGTVTPDLPPATTAPDISGPLRGVRGIDQSGMTAVPEARYEYEICFKCHAGIGAAQFTSLGFGPVRQFASADESQRFAFSNPSVHPVTEGRRGSGSSLRFELQASMVRIYCGDCHAPHGSNEPHILRQANPDTYPAVGGSYPLCFRCHDENYLLGPASSLDPSFLNLHRSHVVDRGVACAVCHDPHGTPVTGGATSSNAAHLINFDTRFAGPLPAYDAFAKSCTVTCHSSNPRSY